MSNASEFGTRTAAPKSLDGSRRDQDGRVGASAQASEAEREDRKAGHEHPLGADAIAERAGGENEGGERDGVGADDPLQLRHAAAERACRCCSSAVLTMVTSS